jgi:hypothetical protein
MGSSHSQVGVRVSLGMLFPFFFFFSFHDTYYFAAFTVLCTFFGSFFTMGYVCMVLGLVSFPLSCKSIILFIAPWLVDASSVALTPSSYRLLHASFTE